MLPQWLFLALGTVLFALGIIGVLTRRNAIVILMSIELMLNGVNLTFVTFSHYLGNIAGQIFAVFIIAVAAGEAAIGLAIIVAIFRQKMTINVDEINLMKW